MTDNRSNNRISRNGAPWRLVTSFAVLLFIAAWPSKGDLCDEILRGGEERCGISVSSEPSFTGSISDQSVVTDEDGATLGTRIRVTPDRVEDRIKIYRWPLHERLMREEFEVLVRGNQAFQMGQTVGLYLRTRNENCDLWGTVMYSWHRHPDVPVINIRCCGQTVCGIEGGQRFEHPAMSDAPSSTAENEIDSRAESPDPSSTAVTGLTAGRYPSTPVRRAPSEDGTGSRDGHNKRSIAVIAEDFDGDGISDLAVADSSTGMVHIRLGNGKGYFVEAGNLSVGSPRALATGDFDGDGNKDLAVADSEGARVALLLGEGNGMFLNFREVGFCERPCSVTVGDFNADGLEDLAVAYCPADERAEADLTILISDGRGGFVRRTDGSR